MRKFANLDTETLMALLLDGLSKKANYSEVGFRLHDLENLMVHLHRNLFYCVNSNLGLYEVIDCVAKYDDMYQIRWDKLEDKEFFDKYDYASSDFEIVSKDSRPVINTFLREFHEDERKEILKAVEEFINENIGV